MIKYQSVTGDLVAVAKNFEVFIYETNTLQRICHYQFTDVVSHLEWSPDGIFILVGIEKRAQAFVKSVSDKEWQCKIDEGLAGMVNCFWAPTSRHIITISEFNLRMTVWSMVDKTVQYINNPKHCGNFEGQRGYCFSPNKKIMALIEKNEDSKDLVSLYDLSQSMSVGMKGP